MVVFGLYVAHIISAVEGCNVTTDNEKTTELNDAHSDNSRIP